MPAPDRRGVCLLVVFTGLPFGRDGVPGRRVSDGMGRGGSVLVVVSVVAAGAVEHGDREAPCEDHDGRDGADDEADDVAVHAAFNSRVSNTSAQSGCASMSFLT